jgi:elongation factor G
LFIFWIHSAGANPWKVVEALRTKLKMHAAALQIPMGAEDNFKGVIDLLKWKALTFEGPDG